MRWRGVGWDELVVLHIKWHLQKPIFECTLLKCDMPALLLEHRHRAGEQTVIRHMFGTCLELLRRLAQGEPCNIRTASSHIHNFVSEIWAVTASFSCLSPFISGNISTLLSSICILMTLESRAKIISQPDSLIWIRLFKRAELMQLH